ncbi:MAG TPA: lytic murein transglycosylase [Candidatus Paceibacterota bacterium]|nr:lytic murein transglycosylase [Candidatus Paceibacterota bacterium]
MKISNLLKPILLICLVFGLMSPSLYVFAQEDCQTKEECEALLQQYEDEIAKLEQVIGKTEQEKKNLQNQISTLKSKVKKIDLQIQQSSVMIKDISYQIKDTEGSIDQTSSQIGNMRNQLAAILQIIYEEDQTSLVEILLSGADISEFFENLMALETLDEKSHDFLQEIKGLKTSLEGQKQSLDTEKGDLESTLKMQTLQKQESQNVQKQQEYFLQLTETQYQQYLKEKQATEAKAAEIRARIFEVVGITKAPTFGEAYSIAKWVEGLTGVRPAFLLAVLQQESAIGKNVGQCYLSNASTGAGVNINSGASIKNVMKPMGLSGRKGDVEAFLTITKELGMDPYKTPVSCPMSFGYGGAMGPAQFIPTTWMIYKSDLAKILGRPANPWNIQDAFLASGLYLARYGAAKQTRDAEWAAAMYYFAGSLNSKYSFYANSVLKIADGFADDIKILEASK